MAAECVRRDVFAFGTQLTDLTPAFRLADTDAIYVGSNVTNVRKLTPTDGFYTYYWPSAQINNSDQIIARDYANGYRYNRIWNGLPGNEGLYTLLPGGSTRDMLTYGSINDNNEVVYPFLYKNTLQGGMATFPNDHAIGMTTGALRPVIDNNGYSVVRMGDADNAPIAMFAPDLSGNTSIAGNAFSAKGRRPSISGQSEAVSFYANFANPAGVGGGPGGGNPGEGTFISLDRAKIPDLTGGRELYRITGQACNGQLDPGEAHNDVNADGVVDPNEDAGFIFHYDIEKRVAINRNLLGDNEDLRITLEVGMIRQQLTADFVNPDYKRADQDFLAEVQAKRQQTDAFDELGVLTSGKLRRPVSETVSYTHLTLPTSDLV